MKPASNLPSKGKSYLVFHPFQQQHTSSLREELFIFLRTLSANPEYTYTFHCPATLGFCMLSNVVVMNENRIQDNPVEQTLACIQNTLFQKGAFFKQPLWVIVDMSWLVKQHDPFSLQQIFLQSISKDEDLKQVNFLFHFDLSIIPSVIIQQSLPLYPWIYWQQRLSQNQAYPLLTGFFYNGDVARALDRFAAQDLINNNPWRENNSFHAAFDHFPNPILEADYTDVIHFLEEVKCSHPDTWQDVIQDDIRVTLQAMEKIKFTHANQTAISWLQVENEESFFASFPIKPTHLIATAFRDHLLQLADFNFPIQFALDLDSISRLKINTILEVFPLENDNYSRMIMSAHHTSEQLSKGRMENLLYKISQMVHSEHNLDSLYREIHTLLNEMINARNLFIALYDEEKQLLDFPYHVDERDKFSETIALRNGKTEYVLRTGKSLLVDAETDTKNIQNGYYELIGPPSTDWLGVPLIAGEKTIGVIAIQTYDDSRLSENDKLVMEFCSSQIAIAIERKIAEQSLKESQDVLSQILMGNTVPTRVIDKHNRTTFFNRAYEKFCGVSAVTVLGSSEPPWKRIDFPAFPCLASLIAIGKCDVEIISAYQGLVKQHPLIEGAYLCENIPIQSNKGLYWVNLTVAPLRDLEGNITGAIENLHDITHRIQAEDHIRTFKTVADYANIGMLIIRADKKIYYTNNYLATKLGYSVNTLQDNPLSTIFPKQYHRIEALVDEMLAGKQEIRDIEISMQTKTQENIPFMLNGVQIKTQHDQQTLISFSCFNLSSQKKKEEALNRYANRLEILHKMDEAILEADSTEEIAHTTMHIFLQLVKFSFTGIQEIHDDNLFNLFTAHYHNGKYTEENYSIPMEKPVTDTFRNYDVLMSEDERQIELILKKCHLQAREKIKACIMIPLIIKHSIIGHFVVGFSENEYLSPEIIEVIKEVSRMVAIGIYQTRLYEKIEAMATIDELTGIYNRRQLLESGERALAQAKRFHKMLSVIVFDIDHFKHVNDTYGHPAGDIALREVIKRCLPEIRKMDIFGRYGGDEFIVFLPETSVEESKQLAERLKQCVYNTPFHLGKAIAQLSISVGISTLVHTDDTLTSLINQADYAMYTAKKSGRNRIFIVE